MDQMVECVRNIQNTLDNYSVVDEQKIKVKHQKIYL